MVRRKGRSPGDRTHLQLFPNLAMWQQHLERGLECRCPGSITRDSHPAGLPWVREFVFLSNTPTSFQGSPLAPENL